MKAGLIAAFTLLILPTRAQEASYCLGEKYDRDFFENLKLNNFNRLVDIGDDDLSMLLADCLGSPDPELRDGIAYEGLVMLLRGDRISDGGKRQLLTECAGVLKQDVEDREGFLKPFSALCVAEVARTDRIVPYMAETERSQIVDIATNYMASITDYRGFDEKEGWRHGVAHASDLLMQLALNDNIGGDDHRNMLDAIATQVSPDGVFYIYGEPARLARPVLFIAMRGTLSEDEWSDWFLDVARPEPTMQNWNDAFNSQAGLAKRHNLNAFLNTAYLNVIESDNENVKSILPGILAAMELIP